LFPGRKFPVATKLFSHLLSFGLWKIFQVLSHGAVLVAPLRWIDFSVLRPQLPTRPWVLGPHSISHAFAIFRAERTEALAQSLALLGWKVPKSIAHHLSPLAGFEPFEFGSQLLALVFRERVQVFPDPPTRVRPGPHFARGRRLGVAEAIAKDIASLFGGKTPHLFVQSLAFPGSEGLDVRLPSRVWTPTRTALPFSTPQPQGTAFFGGHGFDSPSHFGTALLDFHASQPLPFIPWERIPVSP